MKKLFIILTFLFAIINSIQAQNIFDFRLSSSGANPKYTFIHNGQNWQGFIQVGSGYMLWETGPQINLTKNLNITARAGINFSYGSGNLAINPQLALVLYSSWHNWHLLSVNEYTPIKGTEYYYEQELAYKNFGLHLEAIYQNGAYQPFVGPSVSLPLTKGDIFFWLAQEFSAGKKLARVGYKITF